ncbi:MAG: hypothetical protein M3335_06215 [Actinomycetota bacterium]|nr:hypothetical protein [Actinomycetota bacterium]
MSALILHSGAVDKALRLAEVLLSSIAIGSGLGITAAVLERKSLKEIEMWGFWGTALGCLCGILLTLCVWVLWGRA